MKEIRERLLFKLDSLPDILPDREVAEAVSGRVAEWLTNSYNEPTCSIRVKDVLIIAGKYESTTLQLMVFQTSFQLNDSDSPVFGEHRSGPSIVEAGSPVKVIRIPLSEIILSDSEQE